MPYGKHCVAHVNIVHTSDAIVDTQFPAVLIYHPLTEFGASPDVGPQHRRHGYL